MILDYRGWGPRARARLAFGVYMGGCLSVIPTYIASPFRSLPVIDLLTSSVLVIWGMGMTKWLGDREKAGFDVLD